MQNREIGYGSSSQRQLCVLVLDASGSMGSTAAGSNKTCVELLNDGVRVLHQTLMQDEVARNRVRLAIVLVGGPQNDAALLMDWTDTLDFQPFDISAGGLTPLGKGLRIGLQIIEQEKQSLRAAGITYTRPWMFVITDGVPTDDSSDWQSATAECRRAEADKKCVIYPIGVEGADMAVLSQVSSTTPPIHMHAAKFSEFFRWLSASAGAGARSSPGDRVPLPSTDPWSSVQS